MDVLYFLKHSPFDDFEIRYSLRSVEKHLPWVNKIWIFGDKPAFLSPDTSIIEHVPDTYVARAGTVRTPIRNFFLMHFYSSLIPELSHEYLHFTDDYFLLKDLSASDSRQNYYLEDLNQLKNRGTGSWKGALWKTYDLMKRLGYAGYNCETHTPTYLTKKRVFDAYCDLRDHAAEDGRHYPVTPSIILNHALKHEKMSLQNIRAAGLRCGFWVKQPTHEQVAKGCEGKTFFNFDDKAFGEAIRRFLENRFPKPSKYETLPSSSKKLSYTAGTSQIIVP